MGAVQGAISSVLANQLSKHVITGQDDAHTQR